VGAGPFGATGGSGCKPLAGDGAVRCAGYGEGYEAGRTSDGDPFGPAIDGGGVLPSGSTGGNGVGRSAGGDDANPGRSAFGGCGDIVGVGPYAGGGGAVAACGAAGVGWRLAEG
jgi:hypothetical protein